MQRDKTTFFEECKAIFYATDECQKFVKAGNTLYEIDRLPIDMVVEDEFSAESMVSEPTVQIVSETVTIPAGSGMPGCEETSEC